MACVNFIETLELKPFWKREKKLKKEYEQQKRLYEIVNPINKKIREVYKVRKE